MKRPLVPVALWYGAGLLLGTYFQQPVPVLLACSLAAAAITLAWLLPAPKSSTSLSSPSNANAARLPEPEDNTGAENVGPQPEPQFSGSSMLISHLRTLPLCLLVLFTGWTNLSWRTAPNSPDDLRWTQPSVPALVNVRGTLLETPSRRVYLKKGEPALRSLAEVSVAAITSGTNWLPASGNILVQTQGELPPGYYARQDVEITGVLSPPPRALAPGLFDYRNYLRHQGIFFQLRATTNDWRRLSNRPAPLPDRFLDWAQRTLARGLPAEDEPLQLLWAMTLGWKTGLTSEIYEPFMRSGTMHIFAISGLHIALIAGLLVQLLRVLRVSRTHCGWFIIPLLWFYTGATGWQPSAIRAAVMMTVIIGGWTLSRPSDLLNSLAAAAFIILLWDPRQLFGASFQLSFFVVLSIALLLPPFERYRDRLLWGEGEPSTPDEATQRSLLAQWLAPDPLLPHSLVPRWRRWLKTGLRWLTSSLAVSLAAWIGALPLTAYYFHMFSPVTLLANLLIVPLSSAALACNVGSLLCGNVLPWLTELLNHSAWWWMRCMVTLSHWFTALPGSCLYIRPPTSLDFCIYYALLAGVVWGRWLARGRRRWAVAAALGALALGAAQWQFTRVSARLVTMPLDGGMAVYAAGSALDGSYLFDTGNTNSVKLVTKPFLAAEGVNRLPHLVLTHGDLRHIGGALATADCFRPKQVLVSPLRFRSTAYRKTLEELDRNGPPVRRVDAGERAGPWEIFHPAEQDNFSRADDSALVMRANFDGTRVLLMSDLGRPGQEALLARSPDLRADIVITGLPTEGEPLSEGLLDSIQPSLVIVADSEFPAYERASQKFRDRLALRKIRAVYTRSAGATLIEIHGSRWTVRSMNDEREAATPAAAP